MSVTWCFIYYKQNFGVKKKKGQKKKLHMQHEEKPQKHVQHRSNQLKVIIAEIKPRNIYFHSDFSIKKLYNQYQPGYAIKEGLFSLVYKIGQSFARCVLILFATTRKTTESQHISVSKNQFHDYAFTNSELKLFSVDLAKINRIYVLFYQIVKKISTDQRFRINLFIIAGNFIFTI